MGSRIVTVLGVGFAGWVAWAGCHAVFPYEAGRAMVSDARATDTLVAPREDGPVDAATTDQLGAEDAGARPLACPMPAGDCLECDPITSPFCPRTCAAGDCDALPNGRDPWPAQCNQLRYAEPFCGPLPGDWGRSYAESMALTRSGQAAVLARQGFTEWIWLRTELAAGMEGSLVEVRWLPPSAGYWTFTLEADASADAALGFPTETGRFCKVSRGPGGDYELTAAVRLADGAEDGIAVTATYVAAPAVLQSWIADGSYFCRLISEGGPAVSASKPLPMPLPSGGTFVLAALNPDDAEVDPLRVELDYLRVFAPPSP